MDDEFLDEERQTISKAAGGKIEEVPLWRARTPLQRVTQLLKRHGCAYFKPGDDRTPVSMIITRLTAWAYGERDVYGTLVQIARTGRATIECRTGKWWIANPSIAEEDFADKWNAKPERREGFTRHGDLCGLIGALKLKWGETEGTSILVRGYSCPSGGSALRWHMIPAKVLVKGER